MSRKLKYDIPGLDWRRNWKEVGRRSHRGRRAGLDCPDLVVEIGFGRGEFLLEFARSQPDRSFLGIDLSYKRVLKFARRLALTEVTNIRLVDARAEDVVRESLSTAEVAEFWVNFPDPWPKPRHAERRFLRAPIVSDLSDCLRPGGQLFAATDDAAYAEQIHVVLTAEPRLENVYSGKWLAEVPGRRQTAYEREWRARGRRMHFFAYRRREVGG